MQQQINTSSRTYITKNPIRSTIGSIGYGTVNAVELVVESIGTLRTLNRILDKQLLSMEAELDNELASVKKQIKSMAKA
jgi:hypothetical protein